MDKELYSIISNATAAQAKYKERNKFAPQTKHINNRIVADLDKIDEIAFHDLQADKKSDAIAERERG